MTSGTTPDAVTSVQVREGEVSPAPDPAAALREHASLVWTALTEPTLEQLHASVAALGLSHDLLIQTKADLPEHPVDGDPTRRRRPRVIEHGTGRGVLLLTATYDDLNEEVNLGVLTFLVDGPAVLSVSRGPVPDLAHLREHLTDHEDTPGWLLEVVVRKTIEGYDDVLDQLDDDVADVEKQVFDDDRTSHVKRIYGLKRETLELQRAVLPLDEVVEELKCTKQLRQRVTRVREHVARLDALLDSVLSADLAQVGVRQNEDQRTISAWAAIALIPTIVSGLWGMNFHHMLGLSWRPAAYVTVAFIVVVCVGLRWAFRRNGWIGHAKS